MTRIEIPEFAPDYVHRADVRFSDGVTRAAYRQVQAHREALLSAVHRALEAHMDKFALDRGEDFFISRGALTGEYYLELTERYGRAGSPSRTSCTFQARCLGKRRGEVGDYAGVNITLLFHPEDGSFSTFYTGHHVI
jgi:hypothetical protein